MVTISNRDGHMDGVLRLAAQFGGKTAVKAVLREQRQHRLAAEAVRPLWTRVCYLEDGLLEKRFFPGWWSQEEIYELLEELYIPSYLGGVFTDSLDAYRVEGGVWVYHTKAYPV